MMVVVVVLMMMDPMGFSNTTSDLTSVAFHQRFLHTISIRVSE
jgi:hypothetical protein